MLRRRYSVPTISSVLPAPSNLTATVVSSTAINLAWTDNSSTETSIRIERGTDGVVFVEIDSVGPNITTYGDTGLTAGTLYYYRVRARAGAVDSSYSNIASATTWESEVQAYITAFSISDTTEINATDVFIKGLKSNSIYTKIVFLNLRSPTSQAAALGDFISLTSSTAVNSPTWGANGFTYDGVTNYLNSGFNPSTNGVITLNSCSIGFYVRSGTAAIKILAGCNNSVNGNPIRIALSTTTNFQMRCTSNGAGAIGNGTIGAFTGLFSGSRVSSTDIRVFQNGAQIGSTAVTANANVLCNLNMYVGTNNNNGAASSFIAAQECFFYVAIGLTTSEMATLYTLTQTLQTNIVAGGRQV